MLPLHKPMRVCQYRRQLKLLTLIVASGLLLAGCLGGQGFQPQGWAGPVVSDGTIYVGSMKGKLLALQTSNRQKLWAFEPDSGKTSGGLLGCSSGGPSFVTYGSPAVANDIVYIGSYEGTVYALNAQTGAKLWEYATGGPIVGSPAASGNRVIVGSSDGKLYALDAQNGASVWPQPFATGGEIWSDAVVAGDRVYFGNLDHKLYAVDLNSGRLIWEREFEGAIASTPLVVGDRLYIGSFDSKFYALEAATGDPVWRQPFQAENWFWTRPLFNDGTIYVGSLDHNVYAIDADNGRPVWEKPFRTGGEVRSSPIIGGGILVVASNDGKVYGIDPATGTERWAPRNLDAPILAYPWVDGSRVYLNDQKNNMHALDIETGYEAWSIPLADEEQR